MDALAINNGIMVLTTDGLYVSGLSEKGNMGKSGEFYGKFQKIMDYDSKMQSIHSNGYSTFISSACADITTVVDGKCVPKFNFMTGERIGMIVLFTIAIAAMAIAGVMLFTNIKKQKSME